eukprot:Rmarinus@m.23222
MNESLDFKCLVASESCIFSGHATGLIRAWNPDTLQCDWSLKHPSDDSDVASVLMYNRVLFGAHDSGSMHVWNLQDKQVTQSVKAHGSGVTDLRRVGDSVVTFGKDTAIRSWAWSLEERWHLTDEVEWNPSCGGPTVPWRGGHAETMGTWAGAVIFYTVNPLKAIRNIFHVHSGAVTAICCYMGHLVTGGDDGKLKFLDATRGYQTTKEKTAHDGSILSLAVISDRAATCSYDMNLNLFALPSLQWLVKLDDHDGYLYTFVCFKSELYSGSNGILMKHPLALQETYEPDQPPNYGLAFKYRDYNGQQYGRHFKEVDPIIEPDFTKPFKFALTPFGPASAKMLASRVRKQRIMNVTAEPIIEEDDKRTSAVMKAKESAVVQKNFFLHEKSSDLTIEKVDSIKIKNRVVTENATQDIEFLEDEWNDEKKTSLKPPVLLTTLEESTEGGGSLRMSPLRNNL